MRTCLCRAFSLFPFLFPEKFVFRHDEGNIKYTDWFETILKKIEKMYYNILYKKGETNYVNRHIS